MAKRISEFKKGNGALDTITLIAFLIVFGVCLIFFFKVLNQINESIQADSTFDAYSKSELQTYTDKTMVSFDNMFIVVFILLWMTTLVASFYVDSHPIFFGISLILLLLVFFVTPMIGNAAESVLADPSISDTSVLFPKISFILSHMLTVAIVIGTSILVVLFGKNNQ